MQNSAQIISKEPLFQLTKRVNIPIWKKMLVRLGAVAVALIVCGIVSTILNPGSFSMFFKEMFKGAFGTERRVWKLFEDSAILLIIGLALVPSFKMKFWNIGAEGQTLIGALMSTLCIMELGKTLNRSALIVVMLIASIFGGALWAVIPAIFKAKWQTNETLFTLMMNYVSYCLVGFAIMSWVKSGSAVLGILPFGQMPKLGGQPYLLNIIIVLIVTVLLTIYMGFSKHGYELSVVGESMNTAKYVGINTKKVIIRTMILSGAICGIAGWLIVSGDAHTLTKVVVDGRGFTAILVAWLADLNPILMILMSFFVSFLSLGSGQYATTYNIGGSYPDIMTGIFFIIFICSEFFMNYKIKFHPIKKNKEVKEQ